MCSETRGPLLIIACESGRPFAESVFNHLQSKAQTPEEHSHTHLIKTRDQHFANTEIKTIVDESVRGGDVFIFQDVENSRLRYSVDENLRALLTMIDAAKRSGAGNITAVIPAFPYARQDKPVGREGITAARIAQALEQAGADSIVTLDVHNSAIAGFFRQAILENLHASKNIIDFVTENLDCRHLVVAAPDEGGVKRASHYAKLMQKRFVVCYKERDYSRPNAVETVKILGNVKDCDVLVVDDMIDTAGTVAKVCKALKKKGARKVYFACSLPLFNGLAIKRLNELHRRGLLDFVIGTDAVCHGEDFERRHKWFRTASVVGYFAKVINNLNKCMSISKLLE